MLDERPSAAEIIAAVAEFLEQKAAPQLDAHTAFHAKVAVNALRIVERELAQAPAAMRDELARLASLTGVAGDDLHVQNAALCARIDEGRVATGDAALRDHLLKSVLARIAIDSPKYPSLKAVAQQAD